MKISIQRILEEHLAKENRRILSDWRAMLILRRATKEIPSEKRRWKSIPRSIFQVHPILKRLAEQGGLSPREEHPSLYEVTSPYARSGALLEDEILMELHPYAALSHFSALFFHEITEEFPREIHTIIPTDNVDILPLGTYKEEWAELSLVPGRQVPHLLGRKIQWHQLSVGSPFVGVSIYRPRGYPVRVTTLERTLADSLQHPEWCGGFENVLKAWSLARDLINLDSLVEYIDEINVGILRQRVGFITEELGLTHPVMETWPKKAKRGGSSKLVSAKPFSSTHSKKWCLSLNAPIQALHEVI